MLRLDFGTWIVVAAAHALTPIAPAAAQLGDEEEGGAQPAMDDASPADPAARSAAPAAPPPEEAAAAAEEPAGEGEAEPDMGDPTESGLIRDEQVIAEEQLGTETVRSSTDPYEDPTRAYYFLGVGYFHTWTPEFIIDLFTDLAQPASNPALGLQFTYRKDGFDIVARAWYQTYAVEGPFRGPGDTIQETEFINSSLKTIFVGADFMWGTAFNDIFSIQYGLGIGLGVVFDELQRREAYESDGPDSIDGWAPCAAPSTPDPLYCEAGGDYGTEPKWANGGSVPNVWFRIAPQLGFRIKPIKQLVINVNGGFDIVSGFFLGGSLNVGLN
ncbi:MAG TPA: hypothetical protein RMG45_11100 [Polyangiaceae bacterium LLY-WYZ-15_(1-7)]|nr:hypothetical protein [Polyangiaceae bacterium LLY-WYZ-15_(1-7)]